MQTIAKKISIAVLLALAVKVSFADAPLVPQSGNNGLFYYQLRGENEVPEPSFLNTQTIPLSANGNIGLGYNCGVFNPQLSISNALNGIKNSAMNIEQSVISNATSAIYDMPLYLIARANHTVYDLITNQYFNAQNELDVSTKSCETMQNEIGNGQNPYADWATIAVGDDWKQHMGFASSVSSGLYGASGTGDINVVKDEVNTDNGKNGVPWIHHASSSGGGDNAGGMGQPAIQVIHDTVIAGYNVLLQSGRQYDDTAAPIKTPEDAYLMSVWNSPLSAATWIVNVVGDETITTFSNGTKQSTPGVGLLPDVYAQSQTIATALNNLITGSTPITLENLQAIASPTLVLNADVIHAIQSLDPVTQTIIVSKLSQAIAGERIADQARMATQLLLVGESVPQIYGNKAAKTTIDQALARLKDYRANLTFNPNDTFGSAAGIVQGVMELKASQQAQAVSVQPDTEETVIDQGAVKTGESQ